ncbi:MAG: hypothetical protein D6744_08610 [Planctomycetota bacterium]|nr:MAG: hypothetical protein D6744_08610 [Planctomycetota bacterium]
MRKLIPNEQLRLEDLPPPDADWNTISEFALTFDGYDYWGSFEKCSAVSKRPDPATLPEIRTCLFMLQRRARWSDPIELISSLRVDDIDLDRSGDCEELVRARELVEKIRSLLRDQQRD